MKNDTPLVSVLVPICNVERYLRECLNSLVRQTLSDIQIICIDDGSSDSSPAILEEYSARDARIEVITKQNSGYGDSMNKGLDAARGKYLAIVESDDFVDEDAFERLVALAEEHDVEVVKTNFYTHLSDTDYHEDPVLSNLEHCSCGVVLDPADDQNIFLTQPAIWSAFYRRDFLEENGIRFLPTPGASFQDTSFNFKVFACARRVFCSDEAFLHYRIDNSNSSVKQLSKVFCICDEYREMWSFLEERGLLEQFGKRLAQIQYGGYHWNLHRLTPNLQYAFYQRFVDDFRVIEARGLLDAAYFDEAVWKDLTSMLSDADAFFRRVLGPIEVGTTLFVRMPTAAPKRMVRAFLRLAAALPEDGELVCIAPAEARCAEAVVQAHVQDARIFDGADRLESATFQSITPEGVRGETCGVVYLDELSSKALNVAVAWLKGERSSSLRANGATGCFYRKEQLEGDRPLLLPLLAQGFSLEATGCVDSFENLPSWIAQTCHFAGVSKADLSDFTAAKQAFDKLVEETFACCESCSVPEGIFPLSDKDARSGYFASQQPARNVFAQVLVPLWSQLLHLYDALSYNDRKHFGEKPSPASYPAFEIAAGEAGSQPEISVIIPVFDTADYLPACLESVLLQEDVSLEVICIDDGSGDASVSVMEQLAQVDPRLRVFAQLNGGAGAARNRGISLARGRYLAFIDPDDLYPSTTVLHDLLDAAQRADAKMCGGSFTSFLPSGEEKLVYYGNEAPYTIVEEGFRTIAQDQFDYGWIRFIYERSLFAEGALRFPAYRWYEDPVFFLDAVSLAQRYYVIPKPVYLYREDYKEPSWSAVKIRDMLAGIEHNLRFARENDLDVLYTRLVDRIDHDYGDAILEFVDDEEVLLRMVSMQAALDVKRVSYLREQGYDVYVLNPLYYRVCKERKTAVRRMADKVEASHMYEKMQSYYERYRKR